LFDKIEKKNKSLFQQLDMAWKRGKVCDFFQRKTNGIRDGWAGKDDDTGIKQPVEKKKRKSRTDPKKMIGLGQWASQARGKKVRGPTYAYDWLGDCSIAC
jgi:hypothetical protein